MIEAWVFTNFQSVAVVAFIKNNFWSAVFHAGILTAAGVSRQKQLAGHISVAGVVVVKDAPGVVVAGVADVILHRVYHNLVATAANALRFLKLI